jgi:hypothetical protein
MLRQILVEEAATHPLVGMALMDGFDLHIEITNGGIVTIQKR